MFSWLLGSSSKPPILLKLRSSNIFIIITVSTAVFTDVFIYELIVPVLPFSLTTRSGVDPDSVQTWISIFLAVYGAATLIASPFCGYFADMVSSRALPFILGLFALAGSTVLLFIGNSIGVLLSGRILQGMSAAVVGVVGLALVVDTVGPEAVGEAMGYVGLSMNLGILLGPMLSGVVYAKAGYNGVFAMAFGLIALDVFLRLIMIEKKRAACWLPAPDESFELQHTAQQEVRTERAATHLGTDLVECDNTHRTPAESLPSTHAQTQISKDILPHITSQPSEISYHRLPRFLQLLSSRRLLAALWACTIQSSIFTAFDSILPLFVVDTFHWNSIGAGLIFLPMIVASLTGPMVGKLSDKFGARWLVASGFVAACPPLILLRMVHHNTAEHKVLLCALLALFAVAATSVLTPIMAEIAYAIDAKAQRRPPGFFGKNGSRAQAYSLFNMSWAAGSMIGPLLGGLINKRAGWVVTTLTLGIVSLIASVPIVILTGGSIWRKAG